MIMKRGMSKKAQEGGASGATIIGWVILAILLVIIVLAISGFFNPILQKFNLLPGGGLSGLVTACYGYVQLSSKTDYCMFREVKTDYSGKEYVNCIDDRIQADMDQSNKGVLSCGSSTELETSKKNKCIELIKQGAKNPKVNELTCTGRYSCGDLGGDAPTAGKCTGAVNTRLIKGYNVNEECCVAP